VTSLAMTQSNKLKMGQQSKKIKRKLL